MFSIIKKYKRKLNNISKISNAGVTLISLIVTIIVLLILAGITIRISGGNNGLIGKTKKGVALYENAASSESQTLDEYADEIKSYVDVPKAATISFSSNVTGWTNGNVIVTAKIDDPHYEIELKSDESDWAVRDKNKITVTYNQQISARVKNRVDKYSEDVATYAVTNIDKTAPDKTAPVLKSNTNSITVTFKQQDDGSGIAKREYSINNGSTWEEGSSVYTFKGLTQGKKYTIITRATDKVNNQSISEVASITTKNIPTPIKGENLTFVATPSGWTNNDVKLTVSTTETSYSLQTSTDGKIWGTTNPLTYSANGTAYARLWDGNNASAIASTSVTNIDKLEPTDTAPTVATTTNKITATLKQVDQNAGSGSGKSDLNASKTQYRLVTNTSGTTAVTGKDWQSGNVFSGLTQNTTYYVQTKVTDNAGNTTTSEVATARTTTVPSGTTSGVITLTPDHNTWTNTDVKVTARTNQTGYTIQMSTDGKSFTDGTSKTLTSNGTVYARLRDSSNNYGASASISISIIDKVAPTLNISKETYQEGFNNWTLPDGGSIENNILTLTKAGTAMSYYYKTGSERWWITLDGYTNKESTKHDGDVGSAGKGNGGISLNSYYFDNAFKSTVSRNSYSGNGWAPQLPINTWSNDFTWSGYEGYGGKIEYVKISTQTGNGYSQPTAKYRNFKMHGQLYSNFYLINQTNSDNSSKVKVIKYALGNQTVDYFKTAGTATTDGQIRVTANGTYTVYVQDNAGNYTIKTITIDKIDTTAPTTVAPILSTTTNKITVTSKQADGESGVLRTQYAIKESGGNYGNWQDSNSFEKLKQGTKYVVKTRTTNNAGLSSESKETTVTTGTIPGLTTGSNLTFTPSTSSWTNGNVSVAVSTTVKGYTLQTSTDGKTWGTTNPLTYTANGTAYARLWDGNNASAVATTNITNIDKLAPTNTAPTVATTTNKITATLKQVDQNAANGSGKSDLNASKTQYRLVTDTNGTTAVTGKDWQSSNVFSGLTQNTTYYVQTKVTDNAGNTTTSAVATAKTGTIPGLTTGSNLTFTPTPSGWTNGNVSVKVSTTVTGYTLQTSTDGKTWGTTNPLAYTSNGTAYARLWDGNNASAVATRSITNIDKTAPSFNAKVSNISSTGYDVIITGVSDTQSGVNRIQCPTWTESNGQDDIDGAWTTSTKSRATKQSDGSYKFRVNITDHKNENGKYITHVYGYDNVGNNNAIALSATVPAITITWNANGGTAVNATSGKAGNAIGTLPTTTRTGYTFAGWFTAASGGTQITTKSTYPTSGNVTYYAHWNVNQYAVTCEDWFVDKSNNRKVKLGSASKKANYGTTVNGSEWGTDATMGKYHSSYVYKSSTSATVGTSGATVYRYFYIWIDVNILNPSGVQDCKSAYFSLSNDGTNWDTNLVNESSKSNNLPYGTVLRIKDLRPYYSYYEYASCSGCTYSNGQWTYTATAPNSMVIKMRNKTYTITYNLNGGTMSGNPSTYNIETSDFSIKSPSKNGYNFAGWKESQDGLCSSEVSTNNFKFINSTSGNNYAYFKVQFWTTSGTYTNRQIESNDKTGKFTRTWKCDLSTGTYRIRIGTNGNIADNTYSFTLNLTNGVTYEYSYETTKATTQEYDVNNFRFYTQGKNNTAIPITIIPKGSYGNKVYTAQWTEKTYSLQINPNGGTWNGTSAVSTLNKKYSEVTSISSPTRTGYTFMGFSELLNTQKFNDGRFDSGYNGVSLYNNKNNGQVTVTRQAKSSDNPIGGSYELKVTNAGQQATSPNLGGFVQTLTSEANKKYVHLFIAKLPAGYYFYNRNNSLGNGSSTFWLTSNKGTGNWQVYAYQVNTGSSGTFSTFGHVDVSPSATSEWVDRTGAYTAYLAFSNIYDITTKNAGIGQIDGSAVLTANWQDKTAPTTTAPTTTTTTNSITVANKQTDNGSGIASIQYQIKKNGTSTWSSLQSSATFGGLTQNTKYDVRTRAVDKAGNASYSGVTTVTTGTIPTPVRGSNVTFTPTPSGWTKGNVSVKVSTSVSGYTLQTSTNGSTWGTTNPLTYTAKGTAYARLWDGTNASSAATLNVTNIDKLAPTNTAPTAVANGNKITVTLKQTDATATSSYGQSGIKSSETRYAIKKSSSSTWGAWQTSNSFTGLEIGTSYNIKTKVTDNAGNSRESNVSTVTTSVIGCYADVNDDGKVDGVIFIDLAFGASGNWNPGNNSWAASNNTGVYSYSAVTSGLRSYKISTKTSSYTGKFGTKQVIVPNGTSGNTRFYVMALSDYDTYWYNWTDACSKRQTVGSVTFRLPSKEEWSAFGGQLGIDKSNYSSKYGLRYYYWSTTEYDSTLAWHAWFDQGHMYYFNKTTYSLAVRLCATF